MFICIIRNFKKKLVITSMLTLFWAVMIAVSALLPSYNTTSKITVSNLLQFSYPDDLETVDIYTNDNDMFIDCFIQTNEGSSQISPESITKYISPQGKFEFEYPHDFTLKEQEFSGSEILYHIDFAGKNHEAWGFVQIWNLPYSLEAFLEKSKELSMLTFKNFKSEHAAFNGKSGYLWDYSVLGSNQKYYKGSEFFFKQGDRMYRISYFTPEELWSKDQENKFINMIKSFKIL